MNRKRFHELFWEFDSKIEAMHALLVDSLAGFALLRERLSDHRELTRKILGDHEYATDEFQNTCLIDFRRLCGKDYQRITMSPGVKQGDFLNRIKVDGQNFTLLANHCIVVAYSYWEEYLRLEIGKAKGVLPAAAQRCDETRQVLNEHVTSDFWGELRHYRHAILHNNSLATEDVANCKLLRWFSPGDRIELNYERIRQVLLRMVAYRNELFKLALPEPLGMVVPD